MLRLVRVSLFFVGSTSSLTEAVLCERVEQRPHDGDGGADDAERGDGRLEGDHTRDDDHDTLDCIPDGVRHRVDAPERLEGHLVVEVVEGAREERGDREVLDGVARGARGRPRAHHRRRRLHGHRDGDHEEEGEDGEHRVEVRLGEGDAWACVVWRESGGAGKSSAK